MTDVELVPECWLRLEDNSETRDLPWECRYESRPGSSGQYGQVTVHRAQYPTGPALANRAEYLDRAPVHRTECAGAANPAEYPGPAPAHLAGCFLPAPSLLAQCHNVPAPPNLAQCLSAPATNLAQCLYRSDPENLMHIRLEGSSVWNERPDGLNLASAQWYEGHLRDRERERRRNMIVRPKTVRDVIPRSRLATYGNYEYNEEQERKYTMCVNVPYSLDAAYINRGEEVQEIWMSPIVDKLMHIYLNPGDSGSRHNSPTREDDQDPASVLNPRLYTVDNSQHFELEMKIMATKEIWSREVLMHHECYPMVFNQAFPILKPFTNYVTDNPWIFNPAHNRFSSLPYPPYPLHDLPSLHASNQSSSASSSSSCPSTSPLHPVYQQQSMAHHLWPQSAAHLHQMGLASLEDFTLETADLSKFLLFTLDLETEDCMKHTMEVASTWLNQVYPTKHAQKLEVEKQLLSSYTLSMVTGTPLPTRLAPAQVISAPLTTISVNPPVEVLTQLVSSSLDMPRRSSLPLSFSAVAKGACTSPTDPSPSDSAETVALSEKTLTCATRKSRSKHRPPHPTPTRPSGVYTTLSGYKYFSPPRGSSEDKSKTV